jgi:molecular chaperone DnaK (HSP70)
MYKRSHFVTSRTFTCNHTLRNNNNNKNDDDEEDKKTFTQEVGEMIQQKFGHLLKDQEPDAQRIQDTFEDPDVKQKVSDSIHEIRVKLLDEVSNEQNDENQSTAHAARSSPRAQQIKQRSKEEVERRKKQHEEKQQKTNSWVKVVSR